MRPIRGSLGVRPTGRWWVVAAPALVRAPAPDEPDPAAAPSAAPATPAVDDRDDRRHRALIAAICVAAFVGGVAGLASRSLWMDEAMSVGASRNLVEAITSEGSSMGPYFVLLRGVSEVSAAAWWLRLPSLLCAVAALPVLDAVARRLGSRRLAATAVALAAASWLWLRYAQEARSYAMAMLLTTVSWYALLRSMRRDPEDVDRWWTVFAAASVLCVLTHGLGILQLGAQVAVLLTLPQGTAWLRRAMPVVIASGVAMAAMILPGAVVAPQWVQPLSWSQAGALLQAATGPTMAAKVALSGLALAGAALGLVRWRRHGRSLEGSLALVPVAWGLVPAIGLAAMSVADPVLVPRYVIGSVPGVALLIATSLDAIGPAAVRRGATALVLALLVAGQVSWHTEPYDDFRSVARHIEAEARPGDGLFLPNPLVRPQLDYQWLDGDHAPEGLIPMVPLDPIGSLPRFYEVPDVTDAELGDLLVATDVQRVWTLDQDAHLLHAKVPTYLADPTFAATFRVAERTTYDGGLTLYLLVRR